MVQPACGIKRLLEKIGFLSTTQSAHFDNIKSEAKYRLGYFYTQNKITPRIRSPPKFRFHIKNKNLNYGRNKNVKKYYINNGKAVEISEEIHDYLTASDRQIRYCDKDRKKSDPEIDMKKEKVTEILSCKGSLNRLTNLGFDFADRLTGFQESVTDKIMLEQALKKLSDKERFLLSFLFWINRVISCRGAWYNIEMQFAFSFHVLKEKNFQKGLDFFLVLYYGRFIRFTFHCNHTS